LGDQVKEWVEALLANLVEPHGKLQDLVASKGVAVLADKKNAYVAAAEALEHVCRGNPANEKQQWHAGFEGGAWKDLVKHANTTLMKCNGSGLDGGINKLSQAVCPNPDLGVLSCLVFSFVTVRVAGMALSLP
jgi:hypothetical protein